jgi:DNA-binding XRE family transcriptional regulator
MNSIPNSPSLYYPLCPAIAQPPIRYQPIGDYHMYLFGWELRQARLRAHLTEDDMAMLLGVSVVYLFEIEQSHFIPVPEELPRIAALAELIGEPSLLAAFVSSSAAVTHLHDRLRPTPPS